MTLDDLEGHNEFIKFKVLIFCDPSQRVTMNCSFIVTVGLSGSINFVTLTKYNHITGITEGERNYNNNKGTVVTSITFAIKMFH